MPFFLHIILLHCVASSLGQSIVADAPPPTTLIKRTISSVDIQVCVQGSLLTTQRTAFQQELSQYLKEKVLSDTLLYLERQYTTLSGGDICYLYVYQAPNPDYSAYAVSFLTTRAPNQILSIPFTIPSTGVTVLIPCKVDAAQWMGDDMSLLGAPFPGLWKVNDLLLWGSSILSILFVCMAGLCCYALCTKVSVFKNANGEDYKELHQVLKLDREIVSLLTLKHKEEADTTIIQSRLKVPVAKHHHDKEKHAK